MPTMIPVKSSLLKEMGYDSETKELYLRFSGGQLYLYRNFPADLWARLKASPSQGKFFYANIKMQYPGVML